MVDCGADVNAPLAEVGYCLGELWVSWEQS